MTRARRRRTRVVLEAHAPPEGTDPEGVRPRPGEVDWVGTAQALLANSTPLARLGLRLSVLLAWWSPVWLGRRRASLARLDPAARAACLAAMEDHRRYLVREAAFLLKIAAGSALLQPARLRAVSRYDRAPPPEQATA